MKGVVLAGGKGTRLMPLTKCFNKHMLAVYNNVMLHYPIMSLTEAGIKDILIVSSRDSVGQMVEYFGGGRDYNARFSYEIQEDATGIAGALSLARDFAGDNKIAVILGDNLFQNNFVHDVRQFENESKFESKIFLKDVEDPRPYGVAEIKGRSIVGVEEKPIKPKSNLVVTGIYFYAPSVFEMVKKLKPSARGELEITDVNNYYINKGLMTFGVIEGWWGDAGESFDSYLKACNYAALGDVDHKKKAGRPRTHYLDI
jgi:glucose-1-phosphate thymidylyltransferase